MKKVICKVIDFIAFIISLFLNKYILKLMSYFLGRVHWYCIKRNFKKIGNNSFVRYPINLIGGKYITIGDDFNCFSNLRLEAYDKHLNNNYNPQIKIGDNVSINYDCHIACVNKISIGNNVLIASKVFITDHFHGEINKEALKKPPSKRKVISKGEVIIEDNVWIGENVAIMPNVKVGKNSIIGANSVVTKDIPDNCVVAGVPAKVIKIL